VGRCQWKLEMTYSYRLLAFLRAFESACKIGPPCGLLNPQSDTNAAQHLNQDALRHASNPSRSFESKYPALIERAKSPPYTKRLMRVTAIPTSSQRALVP